MYQIFDLVLTEINIMLVDIDNGLRGSAEKTIVSHIIRSNPYFVGQIGTRLSIIEEYNFKDIPESDIHDLYNVRTLVAGIHNTFRSFGKNLNDNHFVSEEYIRFISDIQPDVLFMKDALKGNR